MSWLYIQILTNLIPMITPTITSVWDHGEVGSTKEPKMKGCTLKTLNT